VEPKPSLTPLHMDAPTASTAPKPAFARDLHALVEKHIPDGLTPNEAAYWLIQAARASLDHLQWKPTPTQKACELLASAIELLPGSKQT
jgi:hypothetical protein